MKSDSVKETRQSEVLKMEANKKKRYLLMNEFDKKCGFSDEFLHECELEYEKSELMSVIADLRIENKKLKGVVLAAAKDITKYKELCIGSLPDGEFAKSLHKLICDDVWDGKL